MITFGVSMGGTVEMRLLHFVPDSYWIPLNIGHVPFLRQLLQLNLNSPTLVTSLPQAACVSRVEQSKLLYKSRKSVYETACLTGYRFKTGSVHFVVWHCNAEWVIWRLFKVFGPEQSSSLSIKKLWCEKGRYSLVQNVFS